jgi:DNA-binding Lrp family transcriptional regulator
MTDVYVLVDAEPGETALVAGEIADIEDVTEANVVTGRYDLVAEVDVGGLSPNTIDRLQDEIGAEGHPPIDALTAIDAVDGVADAETAVAFSP